MTGVFLLSNTYHAEVAEVADTIRDSMLLSHAGIWIAPDEYGITQERVQRVDNSCRTQAPMRGRQCGVMWGCACSDSTPQSSPVTRGGKRQKRRIRQGIQQGQGTVSPTRMREDPKINDSLYLHSHVSRLNHE